MKNQQCYRFLYSFPGTGWIAVSAHEDQWWSEPILCFEVFEFIDDDGELMCSNTGEPIHCWEPVVLSQQGGNRCINLDQPWVFLNANASAEQIEQAGKDCIEEYKVLQECRQRRHELNNQKKGDPS